MNMDNDCTLTSNRQLHKETRRSMGDQFIHCDSRIDEQSQIS